MVRVIFAVGEMQDERETKWGKEIGEKGKRDLFREKKFTSKSEGQTVRRTAQPGAADVKAGNSWKRRYSGHKAHCIHRSLGIRRRP